MTTSPDQLIADLQVHARRLRADAAVAAAVTSSMALTARSAHVAVGATADGTLRSISFTGDFADVSAPSLSREVLDVTRAVEVAVTDPGALATGRVGSVTITAAAGDEIPGAVLVGTASMMGPRPAPDPVHVSMVAMLARTGTGPLRAVMDPGLAHPDYERIARTRTDDRLTRLSRIQAAAALMIGAAGNEFVTVEVGDRARLVAVRFSTAALRQPPEELADAFADAHTRAVDHLDDQLRALWNEEMRDE